MFFAPSPPPAAAYRSGRRVSTLAALGLPLVGGRPRVQGMGTSDARAKHRQQMARALSRLVAQARINEGQASVAGRVGECDAWHDVAVFLEGVLRSHTDGHALVLPDRLPLGILP